MSSSKTFNSVPELESALSNDSSIIKELLMRDVAPVVEQILIKHIQDDVYGAYSPSFYSRRNALLNSVYSMMIDDHTLLVTNSAKPDKPAIGWNGNKPGSFMKMIEVGNMGWWKKGFARPAISNAQREVDTSGEVSAAILKGMKRVGLI